jgi:GT2 family glycosyltransferase/glycosyltransferase involved in cell wall biosynthesis
MRIGINLYNLRSSGGGMRQYVLQLVPWLVRLSGHSFVLFYASHGQPSLALILRQLDASERSRVQTVEVAHQDEVFAHADRFDLWFCPLNGFAPDLVDRPTVGTLADVQEQFFPEYFTPEQRELRAIVYPRLARAVTLLITFSDFSRRSICQAFGVAQDKVRVTYLAANEPMRQARPSWPAQLPLLPERFVLYPANLYQHKNHELLLQALALLGQQGSDVGAVLTGQDVSPGVPIEERIAAHGLDGRVLWLGHVSAEALRRLYEQALALCFPSRFEGFGMPLVEAMHCSCPVIATRSASIPEVVGDAALFVEPMAERLAEAIHRLAVEPALRQDLIERGKLRAARYDARTLGRQTLEILDEAADRFAGEPRPASREGVSFVVRPYTGGADLAGTLASLSFAVDEHDEVLITGDVSRFDERTRSLVANLPCVRVLGGDPERGDWASVASRPVVCYLREGDRLCEGATGSALASLASSPECVAVMGEAIATDSAGRLQSRRFVPSPEGRAPDGVLAPPATVFWRRAFLCEQKAHLRSALWPNHLLRLAGERVRVLWRTLAYVSTAVEEQFQRMPGLAEQIRVQAAGGPPVVRGYLARVARQVGGLARRLLRRLPAWQQPLRDAYRAISRRPGARPVPAQPGCLAQAQSPPRVAVVVPVYNKLPLTLRFLASFQEVDYPNFTLFLIDDGSTDGTVKEVGGRYSEVVVLKGDGQLWWSGGTNLGVRHALQAGYDFVLTINNDTVVRPDFLSKLVATAQAHPHSIVGARINYLDQPRKIWAIGAYAHWHRKVVLQCGCHGGAEEEVVPQLNNPCPVEMLTGCGTLVPAGCYREIGLYDESWCPQYHADSEFVLRARKHGYQALVDLEALVWNDVGNTSTCKNPLSRRSPWFWRPLLAIHLRYCPKRYLLQSLLAYYLSGYFPGLYQRLRRLKQNSRARRQERQQVWRAA